MKQVVIWLVQSYSFLIVSCRKFMQPNWQIWRHDLHWCFDRPLVIRRQAVHVIFQHANVTVICDRLDVKLAFFPYLAMPVRCVTENTNLWKHQRAKLQIQSRITLQILLESFMLYCKYIGCDSYILMSCLFYYHHTILLQIHLFFL